MDEQDRDPGRPDAGSGSGPPGAGWSDAGRGAGVRAEPHLGADPGRDNAGRDPHGLEPDRAMPSWRARRGGLDSDLGRMGKVAGGLALALLAVAGGWSMLGRRPHEIPVIEAPPGPLRVRPENPGGMQLANGVDTAPEGAGTLAPPPEVPLPGALRAQIQAGAAATGLTAGGGTVSAGATPQASQGQEGQAGQGSGEAPAASPSGGPLPGVAPAPPVVAAAPHGAVVVPGGRGVASPSSSPSGAAAGAPVPGPVAAGALAQPSAADARAGARDAASRPPSSIPAPAAVAARPDMAPAAGAQGGAMVQLAALDSEQGATAEWQRLQHRMPGLLGARRPEVQRAAHDGHPVWRLRTGGFATAAQAAEFCAQVRAKGTGCSVAAS